MLKVNDLGRWVWGWGGKEVQVGNIYIYTQLIHLVIQKELAQHCKVFILQ